MRPSPSVKETRASLLIQDTLRVLRFSGDSGLVHLPHDGAERCTRVGTQASGWITTDLPWERMGGRGEIDTKAAWVDGRHPASMSIEVLGSDGVQPRFHRNCLGLPPFSPFLPVLIFHRRHGSRLQRRSRGPTTPNSNPTWSFHPLTEAAPDLASLQPYRPSTQPHPAKRRRRVGT